MSTATLIGTITEDPIHANWLARTAARIAKSLRHRSDMKRLEAMDDRLLADMGLSRGAIEYAVDRGC
ncbi:DUF1127 domain-containing protein [Prosthecomicrobium sp. N25]|uniref:DUF1127 domain-containing protein n=1 Tax=Prosthecomicrobium sp. N25 TaxID=3129254 RepID=UPI003076DE2D